MYQLDAMWLPHSWNVHVYKPTIKKDTIMVGIGFLGGACTLLAGQYIWKSFKQWKANHSSEKKESAVDIYLKEQESLRQGIMIDVNAVLSRSNIPISNTLAIVDDFVVSQHILYEKFQTLTPDMQNQIKEDVNYKINENTMPDIIHDISISDSRIHFQTIDRKNQKKGIVPLSIVSPLINSAYLSGQDTEKSKNNSPCPIALSKNSEDATWDAIPKNDREWLIEHHTLAKTNELTVQDTYAMLIQQSKFHADIYDYYTKNTNLISSIQKNIAELSDFDSINIKPRCQFPFCYIQNTTKRSIPIPLDILIYSFWEDRCEL
jgi:hypothetical protein